MLLMLMACWVRGEDPDKEDVEDCPEALWFADVDGDEYGDDEVSQRTCEAPSGFVALPGDCDDHDPEVHPQAAEVCDDEDQDCDGDADEDLATSTWYADGDEDGYGDPEEATEACSQPSGHVDNASDCDDGDQQIHPGAQELWYDDVDQDCAGDDDHDADADGYAAEDDCDDEEPAVHPGAEEICGDGIINDCQGNGSACRLSGELDLHDASDAILVRSDGYSTSHKADSAGDVDGDGRPDLLLGGMSIERSNGDKTGGAYLVLGASWSGEFTQEDAVIATLVGDDEGLNTEWGSAGFMVRGGLNINGDGYADMALGAYTDAGPDCQGAAYLFKGRPEMGGELSSDVVLECDVAGELGVYLVDSLGDLDGDGTDALAVGTAWDKLYLYEEAPLTNGGLAYKATSTLTVGGISPRFAPLGDFTGDGGPVFALASPYDAVYLFDHIPPSGPLSDTSGWHARVGPQTEDSHFAGGYWWGQGAIAGGGDISGDGLPDLVVGCPRSSVNGEEFSGAAYVFTEEVAGRDLDSSEAWVQVYGVANRDRLGWEVDVVPDLDGDGFDELGFTVSRWEWDNYNGEGLVDGQQQADDSTVVLFYGGPALGGGVWREADADLILETHGSANDFFGAGDLDGDGRGDLVVLATHSYDLDSGEQPIAYLLYGTGF